ncbi:ABC transporter permease [Parafrankia discariae]|uniref:ABC transporter permease n=1 Tax=Parafrankia discariae TaxID=365528 RepID=UPI0003A4EEB2|nr:ABC transporter permease [Parafrankia discariae]
MRRQIRSEFLKARSGWLLPTLLISATLLDVLSMLGTASVVHDDLVAGQTTAAAASHDVIRLGFANLLFAALFGVLTVTGEYRTGTISRSLLLSRSRRDVLGAKAVVSLFAGFLFGLAGAGTGLLAGWVTLGARGDELVLDRETWLICLGLVLVSTLTAPWGTFLGWLIRGQVPAVIVTIVWTLIVESALSAWIPGFARFLPGGAQAAIYRDTSTDVLSMPWGLVLFCGWLSLAAVVADRLLRHRDVT